ncbi:MAG: galactokinase, partial [Thermoanaerobaculia bacterium]
MTRLTARVPLRADLAGGTLDLWPLYLFHPGARTVNVAISIYAECQVQTTSDSSIDVTLTDINFHRRYSSLEELVADERMALIGKTLEYFELGGLRIVTRTEAPRGSGLGGSSALAVALVRSFSALAGSPVDGDD